MRIDIHSHCIPQNYISAIREKGDKYPERIRVDSSGQEHILLAGDYWQALTDDRHDPKRIMQDMDESGRHMAVLSVTPRMFHYEMDAEIGEGIAKKVNDGINQMVSEHPDRFAGMATVPLQHPPTAIKELERAVNQLGMRAVEIGSNINGRNLDEPEFFPFFEKAQALSVLIFVHPCNVAGRERMSRYHLSNLIGNPTDTALAIGSLIYGGILERLPQLTLCFSHAGGSMPYLIGRLDHGYKVRSECKSAIPKAPSEYFKRLYSDTIAHSQEGLLYLIQTIGSDKVLLGSDYPADMSDPQPVATVGNLRQISEQDKQRIWGENAARLLRIGK
ncbi:amidohydrolase family protein [Chloroflexota bacterium]